MIRALVCLPVLAAALAATAPPAGQERLSQSVNQFAVEAFGPVARNHENVIFSPYSIFGALSMVLEGAAGLTAREMAAVLHRAYPDAADSAALGKLAARLEQAADTNGTRFAIANGLWVDRGVPLQPEFRQTLLDWYQAGPVALDLSRNPEGARREINAWTAEHTQGKIPQLFAPGAMDATTRLVLSSATYFKGKWQMPFRTSNTRPASFRLNGGASVETPFLNQSGKFGYTETASMQILEMRYTDGGLVFDVLLPKRPASIREIEKSMTAGSIAGWMSNLQVRTVDVALPKFRAESEFSLREVLAALGMPAAFNEAADFSRIDGRRDLFLSQVLHRAFVDVGEEGTEAAAATGSMVNLISAIVPQQRAMFRADHPFVFLIRDTRGGTILFAGRLMHPQAG
jgi:serpin B